MRLEPVGNPIEEKAGEVAGLLSGWTADAVGGRNLILDSHFLDASSLSGWKPTYGTHSIVDSNYQFEVTSDTNLASVRLEREIDIAAAGIYTYTLFVKSPRRYVFRQLVNASIIAVHQDSSPDVNGYIRLSLTFDCPAPGPTTLRAYLVEAQVGDVALIDWVKLERGHEATPWTPAPEDSVQSLLEGNPLSSLLSPFPAHDPALALRVDNSVGTRVFVGDTMIHGDTGWRRETEEVLLNGWNFSTVKYMQLRRVGNKVSLLLPNWSLRGVNKTDDRFYVPPNGFRPYTAGNYGYLGSVGDGSIHKDFSHLKSVVTGSTSGLVEWWTDDPWPTSLPGTPV